MKKVVVGFIGIAVVVTLIYHWLTNFRSVNELAGVYVNQNFDYEPFLTEIPYQPDTLIIHEDGSFESGYWGKGTYKLSKSLKGTVLNLHYNYEFGKGGFHAPVIKPLFGKVRIILYKKKDHHYAKVK